MIPTSYSGTSVWLINDPPNWSQPVITSWATKNARGLGLSNRENRSRLAQETVATIKYGSTLSSTAAATFRTTQRSWDNRAVLVPFWPALTPASGFSASPWYATDGGSPLWVFFAPDWSTYEFATPASDFTPANSANISAAPLLWGKFAQPPEVQAIAGALQHVAFEVVETGAAVFAIRPAFSVSLTTVSSHPVCPLSFDWSSPPRAGGVDVRIQKEEIGYTRGQVETYVQQTPRRKALGVVNGNASEIPKLVQLFRQSGGIAGSWWALTSYVDESAATMLARFAGSNLEIHWQTPNIAKASLEVIEVPTEVSGSVPSGETAGATIGETAALWWGYVVTDGTNTWRFTSHDTSIDAGGLGTFESRPINHGDLTHEINLARNDLDISVGWWSGNPFWHQLLDRNTVPLTVSVYEGTLASPSTATLIHSGTFLTPHYVGQKCTAKVGGLTRVLDLKGPILSASKRCWTSLYSPLCGLTAPTPLTVYLVSLPPCVPTGYPGSYIFVNTVPTVHVGSSYYYDWTGTPPIDNHYRGGIAKRVNTDGSVESWTILASSMVSVSSGSGWTDHVLALRVDVLGTIPFTLTEGSPTEMYQSGWTLRPGCDRSYASCQALGNSNNFRGFPRFPAQSPAMTAYKANTSSKKG